MKKAALVLFFAFAFSLTAKAQNVSGTPHGMNLTWTAVAQGSDTNTIAGYNLYKCAGAATVCVNTSPVGWTELNTSPITGTSYLDPSTDSFTDGSSYTYAVQTVDSAGNQSSFSNTVTLTVPTGGFPVNPAPASLTGKIQ